jgi:hypothetical protein
MASIDESWCPSWGFPSMVGVFGYQGRAVVLTRIDPYRISLRPEQGPSELVWELPALGPKVPSFLT